MDRTSEEIFIRYPGVSKDEINFWTLFDGFRKLAFYKHCISNRSDFGSMCKYRVGHRFLMLSLVCSRPIYLAKNQLNSKLQLAKMWLCQFFYTKRKSLSPRINQRHNIWYLRFSKRRRVVSKWTNVSDMRTASIVRAVNYSTTGFFSHNTALTAPFGNQITPHEYKSGITHITQATWQLNCSPDNHAMRPQPITASQAFLQAHYISSPECTNFQVALLRRVVLWNVLLESEHRNKILMQYS
jgi:hypothetical protein